MKHIEIKINDRVVIDVDCVAKVAVIKDYSDAECVMTINYPESWMYTRVIQHCMSIVECSLGKSSII